MKRYSVTFTGRKLHAIGIFYRIAEMVEIADGEDDSADAIVLKLHEKYEHVHNVRIVPAEMGI